ncbi:MAG TPA: glutathione S-transferase [Alphaproteobacteria bacterium]|nr:glutathione S-transferase [Alphaproteobacteria bacterium]
MARLTLVIGNKRYSSWSLRPWLALRAAGAAFEEEVVPLYREGSAEAIRAHSGAGKVPILLVDGVAVWDSLAICEWVAEAHPEAGLWPDDPLARAVARSASAEMHSGFAALRRHMPMDVVEDRGGRGRDPAALADIARVVALWGDLRGRFGGGGPFLFGRFSIADCMFAPVCTRFETYRPELPDSAWAYVRTILALPFMAEWREAAAREPWELPV